MPVREIDRRAGHARRDRDVRIVLLGTVHPVREPIVRRDPVELRGRLIVLRRPGPTSGEGDRRPAVISQNHPPGVVRIDPQIVRVAVEHGDLREGPASVGRAMELDVGEVERVRALRVRVDARVVPGALPDLVLVVDLLPFFSMIVGDVEASFLLRLDDRVHASGPRRRRRHAHAPPDLLGESLRQLLPRLATIRGFPERRARAAGDQLPRPPHDLPEPCVEDARVEGVHLQLRGASFFVDAEDLLPGLAAVLRAVDAPLLVRAARMTERGDVDQVRVRGVDPHAGDLPRGVEPRVGPGPARVCGLPDAVAGREVPSDRRLSHSHVDDVRIGFGDRDRSHRARLEILVRDRFPGRAGIGRLPDPAPRPAEVVGERIVTDSRDRDRTPAAVWADAAERHSGESVGECRRLLRRRCDEHAVRPAEAREGERDGERERRTRGLDARETVRDARSGGRDRG